MHLDPKSYLFDPGGFLPGNQIHFLVDGAEIFPAIFDAIQNAKSRIGLEIYQFYDDSLGQRVRQALVEACRRGVHVRLIYDSVGSFGVDSVFFEPIRQAGGFVEEYHSYLPWRRNWWWTKRDHRKMLLADADLAILGGMNVAEPYLRSPEQGGYHDVAVQLQGPSASRAWSLFDQVWRRVTGNKDQNESAQATSPSYQEGEWAQILGNDHFIRRMGIRRSILYAMACAHTSLEIINPYFLPDPGIIRALRDAVRRGVQVRVILPAWTDVPIVDLASKVVQAKLLKQGIEFCRWPGFVHAKIVIVDRTWISVGSFNFDYRSLFHNLEVVLQTVGTACGTQMGAIFETSARQSTPIRAEEWQKLSFVTRNFARLLYTLRVLL